MLRNSSCLAGALLLAAAALAQDGLPGEWLEGEAALPGGGRDYRLYVPAGRGQAPLPLVVMLHGCAQGPDSFARSTRMNLHAENGRFLALYPAQRLTANPARCWNWFQPANQVRGSGEPADIVALVEHVAGQYPVDRRRVYVAGLSAGAAMSATLAACYPEVFAAAAAHSGLMYKAADGPLSAVAAMVAARAPAPEALAEAAWRCGGGRPLPVPLMVWQGDEDPIVNPIGGEQLVRQFVALNDWADDGRANGSGPAAETPRRARVAGGYAYSLTRYGGAGAPLVEHVRVEGLGHAWSGGRDDMLFSDGKGPDASLLMWNFFRQYAR